MSNKKLFDIGKTERLESTIKNARLELNAYVVQDDDGEFIVRLTDGISDTIQEYNYTRQLLNECIDKEDPYSYFWKHLLPHVHDLKWWKSNVSFIK